MNLRLDWIIILVLKRYRMHMDLTSINLVLNCHLAKFVVHTSGGGGGEGNGGEHQLKLSIEYSCLALVLRV